MMVSFSKMLSVARTGTSIISISNNVKILLRHPRAAKCVRPSHNLRCFGSDQRDNCELHWDPAPAPMEFGAFTQLELFLKRSQKAMDLVSRNHTHDRISFFLEFYEQYQKQNDPLERFFSNFAPAQPADENRPTCIGRALKMRRILTEQLSGYYPDLKDKLYLVSGCYDPAHPLQKMERSDLENSRFHMLHLGEHLVLVLKFTVENRLGYVIFELSYLNFKPLIIMADNLPPSVGFIYVLDNTVRQYYIAKGPEYITLSWRKTTPDGIKSYRETALYTGGDFKCPDYQAKLSTVYNVQYKYVIADGVLQAHVKRIKNDQAFTVRRMEGKETVKTEIPLNYFTYPDQAPIPKIEHELRTLSTLFRESYESLTDWMTRIALVQNDTNYLKEIAEFVKTLQATRNRDHQSA